MLEIKIKRWLSRCFMDVDRSFNRKKLPV